MYSVYWSFVISEKCMVTTNFRFEYQEHLLSSAFSAWFKPRKNIPVLAGTTHRKPKYLEMRRTYAQ